MTNENSVGTSPSRWRRAAPVITLLFLAPFISEVLYGATRVSFLFALIPEIGVWGCGALIIRYAVRRWHRGWVSLLLLGLALALAEECIIQQTSLAPLIGASEKAYGRSFGVNWIYLLWASGYESVWVVLVPIQLTELLFPERRQEIWLRTGGLIGAVVAFGMASFVAWFIWTQNARPKIFHMPPYNPPPLHVLLALTVILLLIWAAFALPDSQSKRRDIPLSIPRPWLVGLTVCGLGFPWGTFVLVGYGSFPWIPSELVMTAALAWVLSVFFLMRRWISSPAWQETHRFAVVFGAIMACILSGFVVFQVGGALRLDWIGKAMLDAIAVVGLAGLGRRITLRQRP